MMKIRNAALSASVVFGLSLLVIGGAHAQAPDPANPAPPPVATDPNAPMPAGGNARRNRMRRPVMQPNLIPSLNGLTLTDDQKAKIKPLLEKMLTDLNAILTTEQQDQLKQAMASNGRGGFGGPGAGGPGMGGPGGNMGDMLAQQLNLTADQKTKAQPIIDDLQKTMQSIQGDQSLDQQTRRQKMMEAFNTFKTSMRPILTPDQQTQLDNMRPMRGGRRGGMPNNAPSAGGGNASSDL